MRIASLSLIALLALGGSICAFTGAIVPPIARAYTSRVNITLDRQPNESFATLVRRAEAVARAAAQRSFDNDILATEASIIITGQNIGLSAPILTLEVSRQNWIRHPDAQRWSTYYPNSKQLLRIDDPTPAVAASPTPSAGQRPEPTLGTGVIQTTLRWSTIDDLDLEVIDPSNQRVFFANKKVRSGGELDVDSNAGCSDTITNPVENIFWPQTGAPPGNYVVRVNLYQRCATQRGPIAFRLRLLVQGRTQEINGSVDSSNQIASYPFTLTSTPPPPGTPIVSPSTGTGGRTPSTPGQRPANRSGGANQRTNPSTAPGQRPANRSGGTNQRTNPSTTPGQRPANRSSGANQRTNPTTNTGRAAATNRPATRTPAANRGSNTGRAAATNRPATRTPATNRGSNTGRAATNRPATRTPATNRGSNTGRARTGNTPVNSRSTTTGSPTPRPTAPRNSQPAANTNNRPAPTYGPGLIRRARELRQGINNNNRGTDVPEN